jgi:hypothetical protein
VITGHPPRAAFDSWLHIYNHHRQDKRYRPHGCKTTVATVSTRPGRRAHASPWARAGWGGFAVTISAGRSAVTAASSAQVRDASAWPTRRSNSALPVSTEPGAIQIEG